EELIRDRESGDIDDLSGMPLPWSLADVLRRQTADLDTQPRRVLEAAAVLGQRIPFDLLACVTAVDEVELIAALPQLVGRGVLVESGDDEFMFRHALLREAITGSLLGRERRRLHEAALDALLARGSVASADPMAAPSASSRSRTATGAQRYGPLAGGDP